MKTRLFMMVISILLVKSQLVSYQLISDWQWANKVESPYAYGFTMKTDTDNTGNTYCGDVFRDQLTLGSLSLQCQGSGNLFIGKLSSNGSWLWVRGFWGSEQWTDRPWERIEQIQCVDNDVYVLGYTYYPMTIDGITINGNAGSYPYLGPFVAKFNSQGVCTMGTALNPSYAPLNHYISFDQITVTNSAIYVAGTWRSPNEALQFVDISVSGFNDGVTTDYDILYAKIDLQGNIQWVKSIGGSSDEDIKGLCSDVSGNIYLGGEFSSTMIAGSTQLVSSGFKDVFIVKVDTNGNVGWGCKCGGIREDEFAALAEKNGVVFVTGRYTLQTSFGQLTLDPINTTTSQPGNIFIASLTNSGSWSSVNRIANAFYPQAIVSNLVVDDNSVYVLIPRAMANNYSSLQFGDDFSWYPSDIPIDHQCHVIAGLNKTTNHWFGLAYAEVVNDLWNTKLNADSQYLYLGTPVSDNVNFGSINITATMSSCYAIGKISKGEVVENNDETNASPLVVNMVLYPNPVRSNTSVNIEYQVKTMQNSSIDIFNIKGQKVMSFNNLNESGKITWNGLDNSSNMCASGLYFFMIKSGGTSLTKKVVLTK
ncbi:MAG: T9SS type A sorting domain-containing protein [Parabacteroides sp.]|nr:T9SS type A sorting domain-containing protein [Parabacteroides sp.]